MPAMLELRIRACHVRGSFVCKDNVAPALSTRHADRRAGALRLRAAGASAGDLRPREAEGRARAFRRRAATSRSTGSTSIFDGAQRDVGLIVQGGLYNALVRALQQLGLADAFGDSELPMLVLNVTFPLVPDEIVGVLRGQARGAGGRGGPARVHRARHPRRRCAGPACRRALHGKDLLPAAGEYTVEVIARRPRELRRAPPAAVPGRRGARLARRQRRAPRRRSRPQLGSALPARPPSFCVGCPERPVFAALKLAQQDVGPVHIAADIGCHAFATFEPFSSGHSILGYGMSLASSAGVAPMMQRRVLSVMGDGGFWHNGLLDRRAVGAVQRRRLGAADHEERLHLGDRHAGHHLDPRRRRRRNARPTSGKAWSTSNTTIESTLEGPRRAVAAHRAHLPRRRDAQDACSEAFTTEFAGLKVIIAEGECQLERQRRIRPWIAGAAAGRQARRARQVRRRRGRLHRRPRLHPPVRLPDADA